MFFFYKVEINGKQIRSKSRYGKRQNKEEAIEKIKNKKDEKIKVLTLSFD